MANVLRSTICYVSDPFADPVASGKAALSAPLPAVRLYCSLDEWRTWKVALSSCRPESSPIFGL
jgi:hypothetical protein